MVSRCIATFVEENGEVYSVAVMKNKRQFVSVADLDPGHVTDYSWSIKLWDIATRQCVRTFTSLAEGRNSRCRVLSLDEETFLCELRAMGVLVLYNVESNEYVKRIELNIVQQFAVLDRDRFLTGTRRGDVKVWSFDTGECQRTLHLVDNYLGDCSISKFDNESFLCGVDSKVLLCNVKTGDVMKSFDVDGGTDQIAVIDSKRFLTVQHLDEGSTWCAKVTEWNANSGECIQRVSIASEVLQAIPVGGHGVLLRFRNDIELRGGEMKNLKRCFVGHEDDVRSIDVVSDTTFISGSEDGTIKIWDLSSWPDLRTLICLRKLVKLGRAEKVLDVHRSKRLRDSGSKICVCHEVLPSLEAALVCETPDEIFRTVLSFLA